MGKTQSFRDLLVWQEAMKLAEMVYQSTRAFPKEELFAMTSQIRRAAVSIPSNIAEGNGRNSRKDYLYFLSIASGSLAELQTQVELAHRINYLSQAALEDLVQQGNTVGRMLTALKRSLAWLWKVRHIGYAASAAV
ncbi:four helix bundle protein [Myxococcota bacterium]|nr:four helix bundle protein [Myxococcota bacterium]